MLAGGKPDSGGSQFFICVVDQPGLDGVHDVFGRVSEGMLVVQKISEAPADAGGRVQERIAIRTVTIRDKPPPAPEPFSGESIQDLSAMRAVLETSLGAITIEFFPERAPNHVRNFLRLAQVGVYDGMAFHRVARGFVIQTGYLPSRVQPLGEAQQRFASHAAARVQRYGARRHRPMARGDDPRAPRRRFSSQPLETPFSIAPIPPLPASWTDCL